MRQTHLVTNVPQLFWLLPLLISHVLLYVSVRARARVRGGVCAHTHACVPCQYPPPDRQTSREACYMCWYQPQAGVVE